MAPARKKILAINFFPAFTPPKSGGELRYYHIYKHLREYYDITMVNPTHLFVEPEEIHHFPNMIEHRIPKNKRHLFLHRAFSKLFHFRECSAAVVMIASYFDRAFKARITEVLPRADIVVNESPFLIHLTPKNKDQLLIYNSYNIEYNLQREMLGGVSGRFISGWIRRHEKKACRISDLVFATSEEDRQGFSDLYNISARKVLLIPNGVDPSEHPPPLLEERLSARKNLGLGKEPVFIFFGSAHPPNIKAVEFIVSRMAPFFQDASFLIAGKVCQHFEKKEGTNIRYMGRFSEEEKRGFLQAADIALNPMFSGSGTNLKMFDYFSSGLPVIATPKGARGIPLRN